MHDRSRFFRAVLPLLVIGPLSVPLLHAQELAPAAAEGVSAPGEQAKKFLAALEKHPEPGYLFDRFHAAWLAGNSNESLEAFLKVRAQAAPDSSAWLLLAFFYEKEGRDVEALKLYENGIAKAPADPAILFHKANLETDTANFDAAIASFNRALGCRPNAELEVKILKRLGQAQARSGKTEEARKIWERLQSVPAADAISADELVDLYLQEGLYDDAIRQCQAAIAKAANPYQKMTASFRLGEIYQLGGRKKQALELYAALLPQTGAESWAEKELLAQLGQLFSLDGQTDELVKTLAEYAKANPRRIAVLRKYAIALQDTGGTDAALAAFRQILDLTPGNLDNQLQYAQMLARAERFPLAAGTLRALTEQHPENADLQLRLAEIAFKSGDIPGVIKAVDASLKLKNDEFAFIQCARLLAGYSLPDAATARFQAGLAKHPGSFALSESFAEHLIASGKRADGLRRLAGLADPSKPESVLRAARALSFHNAHEDAFNLLVRYAPAVPSIPFLTLKQQEADAAKHPVDAFACAQQRIALATEPREFADAVTDAATLLLRFPDAEKRIAALAKQIRAENEACLFVEVYRQKQDFEPAQKQLSAALKERPDSVKLLSQQLNLYRQTGDWSGAVATAKQLCALQPNRRAGYLADLADFAFRANNHAEALRWVHEWKKSLPSATDPWLFEAGIYSAMQQPAQALRTLSLASAKFPQDDVILAQLANAYVEQQKWPDAARIHWKRLENTQDPAAKIAVVFDLARVAEYQGRERELTSHFEARAKANPGELFPVLALATINRVFNNNEQRRRWLMRAAEIKPDDFNLLQEVAELAEADGDYQQARAALEKLAAANSSPKAQLGLMRFHFRAGNETQALAILSRLAAAKLPAADQLALAQELICSQRTKEAFPILQTAAGAAPDDYHPQFMIAVALEESEQPDAAIEAFFRLLSWKSERPNPNAANAAFSFTFQHRNLFFAMGFMPPELRDFYESQYSLYQVYSYRQQRRSRNTYSSYSSFPMPSTLDELKQFAFAHIRQLVVPQDAAGRSAIITRLRAAGIAYPEIKLLPPDSDSSEFLLKTVADLRKSSPDDPTLVTLLLFSKVRGYGNGFTAEDLPLLKHPAIAKNPQFAALLALVAVTQGVAKPADLAPFLAAVDTADGDALSAIFGQLSRIKLDEDNADAKPIIQQWSRRIVDRYFVLCKEASSNQAVSLESRALLALVFQTMPTDQIIEFLNREMEAAPAAVLSNQQWMIRGYSSSSSRLTQKLSFPPDSLPGFPRHLLNIERIADQMAENGDGQPVPFAAIAAAADKIQDPILRALIANAGENKNLLEVTMNSLISSPSLRDHPAQMLFVAAWHVKQEQPAKATALLDRLRQLPMSKEERLAIDGQIIEIAINSPADKTVNEAARKAVLRLQAQKLPVKQRQELVGHMHALGMSKEADALDASIAIASTPASSSGFSSYGRMPDKNKLIQKMFADDKGDQAIVQIINVLRMHIQDRTNANSSDLREIKEIIETNDVSAKVLAALGQGQSDLSERKQQELAFACQLLDQPEAAITIYQALIKEGKRVPEATTALIILLGKKDPKSIPGLLAKLSPKDRAKVAASLFSLENMIHSNSNDENSLSSASLLVIFQALAGFPEPIQPEWVAPAISKFSARGYGDINGIPTRPSLFHRDILAIRAAYANANLAKLINRLETRESNLLKLLAVFEQRPELVRAVFNDHYRFLFVRQGDMAPLAEVVRQALLKETAPGQATPSNPMHMGFRNLDDDDESPTKTSPEEFLAAQAFRAGDRAKLDAYIAMLRTSNPKAAATLALFANLYFATPAEFAKAASEVYAAKSNSASPIGSRELNAAALAQICRAWDQSGQTSDLWALIADKTGLSSLAVPASVPASIPAPAPTPAATRRPLQKIMDDAFIATPFYFNAIASRPNAAALATRAIREIDVQLSTMPKNPATPASRYNRTSDPASMFSAAISNGLTKPSLTLPILSAAAASESLRPAFPNISGEAVKFICGSDAITIESLINSPLFADYPVFNPFACTSGKQSYSSREDDECWFSEVENSSKCKSVLQALSLRAATQPEFAKKIQDVLSAKPAHRTLGSAIFTALLAAESAKIRAAAQNTDTEEKAILMASADEEDTSSAEETPMPASAIQELGKVLAPAWAALKTDAERTQFTGVLLACLPSTAFAELAKQPATAQLAVDAKAALVSAANAKFEKFLVEKRIREDDYDSRSIEKTVIPLLLECSDDPARFDQIVDHAIKLAKVSGYSPQFYSSSNKLTPQSKEAGMIAKLYDDMHDNAGAVDRKKSDASLMLCLKKGTTYPALRNDPFFIAHHNDAIKRIIGKQVKEIAKATPAEITPKTIAAIKKITLVVIPPCTALTVDLFQPVLEKIGSRDNLIAFRQALEKSLSPEESALAKPILLGIGYAIDPKSDFEPIVQYQLASWAFPSSDDINDRLRWLAKSGDNELDKRLRNHPAIILFLANAFIKAPVESESSGLPSFAAELTDKLIKLKGNPAVTAEQWSDTIAAVLGKLEQSLLSWKPELNPVSDNIPLFIFPACQALDDTARLERWLRHPKTGLTKRIETYAILIRQNRLDLAAELFAAKGTGIIPLDEADTEDEETLIRGYDSYAFAPEDLARIPAFLGKIADPEIRALARIACASVPLRTGPGKYVTQPEYADLAKNFRALPITTPARRLTALELLSSDKNRPLLTDIYLEQTGFKPRIIIKSDRNNQKGILCAILAAHLRKNQADAYRKLMDQVQAVPRDSNVGNFICRLGGELNAPLLRAEDPDFLKQLQEHPDFIAAALEEWLATSSEVRSELPGAACACLLLHMANTPTPEPFAAWLNNFMAGKFATGSQTTEKADADADDDDDDSRTPYAHLYGQLGNPDSGKSAHANLFLKKLLAGLTPAQRRNFVQNLSSLVSRPDAFQIIHPGLWNVLAEAVAFSEPAGKEELAAIQARHRQTLTTAIAGQRAKIAKSPAAVELKVDLVQMLASAGQSAEAIAEMEKIVQFPDKVVEGNFFPIAMTCYAALNRHADAIAFCNRIAAKLEPTHSRPALYSKTISYALDHGMNEEALKLAEWIAANGCHGCWRDKGKKQIPIIKALIAKQPLQNAGTAKP